MFASRLNAKLDTFGSWRPDPENTHVYSALSLN